METRLIKSLKRVALDFQILALEDLIRLMVSLCMKVQG